MTLSSTTPTWRARTVAVDDPGDLTSYLSAPADIAWIRRGEGLVGIGVAERIEVTCVAEANEWWAEFSATIEHETEMPGAWGTGPIAFGSFVFDPGHTAAPSILVVPRAIVGRRDGLAWLTTLSPGGVDDHPTPTRAPLSADHGELRLGVDPDAAGWAERVAAVQAVLADPNRRTDRVVLARHVSVTAQRPLDARLLVERLAARYPSCTTFHLAGLVGATPELLIRCRGGLATSRVLTGSASPDPDASDHQPPLAHSARRLDEHAQAVRAVVDALSPCCGGMNVPEAPYELQLPNVMQLASDVTGAVPPGGSALNLVERMHPTAAVCGTPTSETPDLIARFEGIDRGRYTGPVGWIDSAGEGEWAVALRCGQIRADDPHVIDLFAGSGILAASDADAEWAVTAAKLEPMLDALGVRH